MTAADPSLRLETDAETGQTRLAGMGQLHLEIAAERLETEHRVAVTMGRPRVAYRATLRRTVRHELRHVHPVVDVRIALLDGAIHTHDSSELAFEVAGGIAFREAAERAEPCLLEPVMLLEVSCPEAHVGGVVGDLGRRGGQVLGLEARGEERAVRAEVPLARMFGYAGALSGLTHGRRFTLEPLRYQEVPTARARLAAAA